MVLAMLGPEVGCPELFSLLLCVFENVYYRKLKLGHFEVNPSRTL